MALETSNYNIWQTCRRAGQLVCLALFVSFGSFAHADLFRPSTWFCNFHLLGRKAGPPPTEASSAAVQKMLDTNDFEIMRGFDEYYEVFGDLFFMRLAHLRSNDIWVDMGAGAAHAQVDVIEASKTRPEKPQMVAVGFTKPTNKNIPKGIRASRILEYIRAISKLEYHVTGQRLKYVEADITDVALSKIADEKTVSLMTDYFGPISYATDLTKVLKVYGGLLARGGELFVTLNNERLKVLDPIGGREMTLANFIKFYCTGFDVHHSSGFDRFVRNEMPLFIPALKLTELSIQNPLPPPTRHYEFVDIE